MPEEIKDVKTEETSTSEQVQEKVEDTTAVSPEQETTEQQPPEQGQAQIEAVDEQGVPYKNRAAEWQRKYHEAVDEERLENVARKVLQEHQQTQQPQREIGVAELEQYAIEHPEARPYVEAEKLKIIQNSFSKITEEKVKEVETKQKNEAMRQQSLNWALNNPRLQDCFSKDIMGNKVWNNQHPLTQMIGVYMNEPDLKKRPDALVIASKLALADFMEAQTNNLQKKVKSTEQSLKKTQKATLIEGSPSQRDVLKNKTKYSKAMDTLRASGSKEALREVLKAKLGIED